MRILILRGPAEIKGNFIKVEAGGCSTLVNLGMPLIGDLRRCRSYLALSTTPMRVYSASPIRMRTSTAWRLSPTLQFIGAAAAPPNLVAMSGQLVTAPGLPHETPPG